MKLIVLYGSVRRNGNSELLATEVLKGIKYTKRYLTDYRIEPIDDQRHTPEGFTNFGQDDYRSLIAEVLTYDIVIYVTPLYWYGMSGIMKDFIDRFTESLRDPKLQFKKRMQQMKHYVVIAGGDSPHEKGMPLVQQFAYIFDFLGAKLDGWVIGDGNKPGEVLQDEKALQVAQELNAELKKLHMKQ